MPATTTKRIHFEVIRPEAWPLDIRTKAERAGFYRALRRLEAYPADPIRIKLGGILSGPEAQQLTHKHFRSLTGCRVQTKVSGGWMHVRFVNIIRAKPEAPAVRRIEST